MLDLKRLCENPDAVRRALESRGASVPLDAVLELNAQRKKLQFDYDRLRAEQNAKSGEIVACKKEGRDAAPMLSAMKELAGKVKELGELQAEVAAKLESAALLVPNVPHDSVPVGRTPEDNKVVHERGERPVFSFRPREHWELGETLGLMDFARAAKISGSRFAVLKGPLAKMERALIAFMLDTHTRENGYEEVLPPFLVNREAMTGTGQLPKFEDDAFRTTTGHFLIPTAEVPVTNLYRGEILDESDLPKRFCAWTPCFRSEAGSHGKDLKGLTRQHQFNKVELVKIVAPETSYDELEGLTRDAETILEKLSLPYRRVLLCSGDMGFSSAKTYDLEVWLPGQNAYREISSCSNCGDFQARRMNTRFRRGKGVEFVHTLNGSGLAVGRTLIAILENCQNGDGSVAVPMALRPYMVAAKIG